MPQVCEAPAKEDVKQDAKPKCVEPFGYQLLLDLYDCKPGSSDDLRLCYNFLEKVVKVLKVEQQSPPFLFQTDGSRYPDKAGLSGWIPLVESGIQIHTLSPKEFISIDIYSCRKFAVEPLKQFVRSQFSPRRMDAQFVERGLDYHKDGS